MGQKTNPIGLRLGISVDWNSIWYSDKGRYAEYILQDYKIREYLRKELANASVSKIRISRPTGHLVIDIHTARPGIVIGKKGEDINRLRIEVAKRMGISMGTVRVNVVEIRNPDLDAQLVAANIASQIEGRVMFRRAMKRAVANTMKFNARGVKIRVSGRLNGAEIARCEWYHDGSVPLHTFRVVIDYGFAQAFTPSGVLGVKVWICCKSDVFDFGKKRESAIAKAEKGGEESEGAIAVEASEAGGPADGSEGAQTASATEAADPSPQVEVEPETESTENPPSESAVADTSEDSSSIS